MLRKVYVCIQWSLQFMTHHLRLSSIFRHNSYIHDCQYRYPSMLKTTLHFKHIFLLKCVGPVTWDHSSGRGSQDNMLQREPVLKDWCLSWQGFADGIYCQDSPPHVIAETTTLHRQPSIMVPHNTHYSRICRERPPH